MYMKNSNVKRKTIDANIKETTASAKKRRKHSSFPLSFVAGTRRISGSPHINGTVLLPFGLNHQSDDRRRSLRISEASQLQTKLVEKLPTKPVPEKAQSVHPPRAQPCIDEVPNTEIRYLLTKSSNLSARQSPEEAERQAKLEAERLEAERQAKAEALRQEVERRAKAEAERVKAERQAKAEAARQQSSTTRPRWPALKINAQKFAPVTNPVWEDSVRKIKKIPSFLKQGLIHDKTQCRKEHDFPTWIGSEDEPAWLIVSTLVLLLLSLLVLFISTPATLASLAPTFGRLYSPPKKISLEALIRAQVLHFNVGRQADPDIEQMLNTFKSPTVALKVLELHMNDVSSNINVLGRLLTRQENLGIARSIKEIEATLSELQNNHNIDGLTWTHTEKGVKQKLTSLQERFNDFEIKSEQQRARYLTNLENQQREEHFASTSPEDQLRKSAIIIAEIDRQTLDSMQIQSRFQRIEAPLNSGLTEKDLGRLVNRIKEMILPPFAKQSMTASQSKVWHDIGKLVARADHHLTIGKLDEKGARKIIKDVIKENDSEIVELPNYAAANLGAKIIEAKAHAEKGKSFLQRLHQTLKNTESPSNSPDVLLSTSSRLDHCWAFKGQKGSVTVRLAKRIDPRQISMKNVHPKVALDPSTAPRQFSVYGFESMAVPLFLGNFTYNINDKPDQVFEIQHSALITKISKVRFDFLSNYGHPNFTCVYRVGVHGK